MSARRRAVVVGVAGVTNGGKTTLAQRLHKTFPHAKILYQDHYFIDEDSPMLNIDPELKHANWEELSALKMDDLVNDARSWIAEETSIESNEPALLIIEGFLLYTYRPLEELFNKKFFLHLTKEACWERRKTRTYMPPDPPGYFDKIVWPEYIQATNAVECQADIEYIDGSKDREEIYQHVRNYIQRLMPETN